MNIGETIQRLRTERRLSQEQLAELVGVSRQAVSKWELNAALPDTDKLVPLARALGVSVDELLGNVSDGERRLPLRSAPQTAPSWFATHWYWLGLIPVAWGCYMLIQLLLPGVRGRRCCIEGALENAMLDAAFCGCWALALIALAADRRAC